MLRCYIDNRAPTMGQRTTSPGRGQLTMLMRTDPFRDLDRLTQQVFGTVARPAAMPMDAFRRGDTFYIKLDLPGITLDAIELTVEQNVLTVHADKPGLDGDVELLVAERPVGTFTRQVFLGDTLDPDNIE